MKGLVPTLLACAAVLAARPASAQRVSLETLADVEGWKTDDSSSLLAANGGKPFGALRLHVWGGLRIAPALQLLALGEAETTTISGDDPEAVLELLELRYTPSRYFRVGAGRILMPMGLFGARRFSHVNPLIGAPDLYPTQYPWGVNVSGAAGIIDYHAGVVSLPVVNTRYTPEPSERMRPIAGIGVTLGPALRLGLAATRGSYLGRNAAALDAGRTWSDYRQTVVSTDLRFSAGYFEARAEAAWSRYEAPQAADDVPGFGAYIEARMTVSPRVFVAARAEHFDYAFIENFGPVWAANQTLQRNAELGVGYRFSEGVLLKTSFRKDSWPGASPPGVSLVDGYAFAVQLSWHAFPLELLRPKY